MHSYNVAYLHLHAQVALIIYNSEAVMLKRTQQRSPRGLAHDLEESTVDKTRQVQDFVNVQRGN